MAPIIRMNVVSKNRVQQQIGRGWDIIRAVCSFLSHQGHWGKGCWWCIRFLRRWIGGVFRLLGGFLHIICRFLSLVFICDIRLNAAGRIAVVRYEYERAAMYLEEAASRHPGSAATLARYGSYLQLANSVNGTADVNWSFERALRVIDEAVQLDPLSLEILRIRGNILIQVGDCDSLARTRESALELDPNAGRFSARLAKCIYETQGDVSRALLIAESEPLGFAHDTLLAVFHHALGNTELAKQYLDHMFAAYGDSAAYQYGQIYAQWEEPELALTWLETALEIHDPGIILSGNDRFLDPLRDEPRFQKILEVAGYR